MGATLDTTDFLDAIDAIAERADDVPASELHAEMLAQMRRGNIPSDTGRLRASLTNAGHADHIFEVTADGVKFGSRDPAARYNGKAVPAVDGAAVAAVVARHVFGGD